MGSAHVTIVSGLPRSGTSLMMQMLEAGGLPALTDHARTRDDDNPRGYYELEAVKRTSRDPTWLDRADGRAVKVVHALLRDLPAHRSYRVVFMKRDLAEVVRSQGTMLSRRGTRGADLTEAQLIQAFERQLERVERWLAGQPNFAVIYVSYNALMADPRRSARAVNDFLGGSLDADAMAGAVDPALYRQRDEAEATKRRSDEATKGWGGLAILVVLLAVAEAGVGTPGGGTGVQQAYIGPGAGIALLGSFLAVFSAVLSAFFFALSWPLRFLWRAIRGSRPYARASAKRVVVLGLDGLEPTITERLMAEGRLPNLSRLAARGTYTRLKTTCPPLSPVAWSSFTTGTNPGKHNIYDFIGRNPATYRPTQSSVQVRPGRRTLRLGSWVIPLSRPEITGLRKSKPFWSVLGEAGIFSAVIRVPITFPPDRFRGVELSAMCVPDLRGTHGMFSYFEEGGTGGSTTDGDVGGDVIPATRQNGTVRSFVRGPQDTLRAGSPESRVPFRVTAAKGGGATLHIAGQRVPLEFNRHSDWVTLKFPVAGGLVKVRGVCRFLLKRYDPPFEMYCTPVQIDPERPVMPISHPRQYSKYLAKLLGTYATLGLAEDTWSLSEGRLDEDAFLAQAYSIHAEREAMFFDALRRVRRGLVACVFDGPDRIQHMFWRFIDEGHPALKNGTRAAHRETIPDMYVRMDDLVGRTMATIDDDTLLIVMSDHGFKPFRRGVDLNAWLEAIGYLALKPGAGRPGASYLADVDWSRTRAYALGLAGIYLNVAGREAKGTVPAAEAATVTAEISKKLSGLRDPGTGEVAIHEAMPRASVYRGPYVENAPDIVVGYTPGYRVSWDAVIGKCGPEVFSDNTKAWSGDHCIHPDLVPGVLFCSRKLAGDGASIVDIAPTALEVFGIPRPEYMDGKSLLCAAERG